MCRSEAFESSLPRSMEGEGLTITEVRDGKVIISDGQRSAFYVPMEGEALKGADIQIVPGYTEAGYFNQVNVISLTDGHRTALYEPEGIGQHPC
jgi:hypothetical protein